MVQGGFSEALANLSGGVPGGVPPRNPHFLYIEESHTNKGSSPGGAGGSSYWTLGGVFGVPPQTPLKVRKLGRGVFFPGKMAKNVSMSICVFPDFGHFRKKSVFDKGGPPGGAPGGPPGGPPRGGPPTPPPGGRGGGGPPGPPPPSPQRLAKASENPPCTISSLLTASEVE